MSILTIAAAHNNPVCKILWNTLSVAEWTKKFARIHRSTLLQDADYVRTVCAMNAQKLRAGLIMLDNIEAGMVLIQEAGLLKSAIHAVTLDRGPLWFQGFGTDDHHRAFWEYYQKEFPNRLGRKKRILPELHDTDSHRTLLAEIGLKRRLSSGYKTIWIDLKKPDEILRKNMHKKWRNALAKAEKQNTILEWDWAGKHIQWILKHYAEDKIQRNYAGPSIKLMSALAKHFIPYQKMMIGLARHNEKTVAGILIIRHGAAATYQIGWSGEQGRKINAHHLLLWSALPELRKHGITDLDCGGLTEDDTHGLNQFKSGIGGETDQLVGHYY